MTYYKGLIDKYREYLPVNENTPIVTLNEGNTPLIKADNLANKLGLDAEIYLKFEGSNPTGSFKDRGMTMAVTKAKEEGCNLEGYYVWSAMELYSWINGYEKRYGLIHVDYEH